VKWSDPGLRVDQVITQVKLPPYHGPRSPLDLVASEIVFRCIFEAFHQMSQDGSAAIESTDDAKPAQKRAPMLR
jgi:hypothetical protein